MRRLATLLREPPPSGGGGPGGGDNSINTSICSSPQSGWEPGDRGAAPVGSARSNARNTVIQHQFTALAERVNVIVAGLQRQNDTDRRRLTQLERKLEARIEERVRDGDGREKWAEIQGCVTGLIEETQALTRRVEGLDERLWARTSGSELTKQRNRELEQQVQAWEQQSRLGQSTLEETSKRQAAKLRRSEHALEEAQRRLAKLEEEVRVKQQTSNPRDGYLEARLGALEHQQERLDNDVRTLQMQVDDGLQGTANMEPQEGGMLDEAGSGLEEAIHATERGLATLEKKVSSQVEEMASSLASLRVKVDGQLQRVGTLAERLETAHAPAMESMRAEFAQARQQDRREVDAEVTALRGRLQEATEGHDEAMVEVREALRQNGAQIAALSLRPEESPTLHIFDERLAVHEQEMCDLRARLEAMPGMDDDGLGAMAGKTPVEAQEREELEDMRRRLEWLEEQGAAGAASERADQRQAQDTICNLVQGVSRLRQQASSSESAHTALCQQVAQLQGMIERRWSEDSAASRVPVEVEAKVAEMWEKVAELHARLLEVEGGLDFARTNDTGGTPGEVSVLSRDGGARVVPPLPLGEAEPEKAGFAAALRDRSSAEVKEKLEAVAEHLEVVDDLADRVAELERRLILEAGCLVSSPAKASEVSFGGDAPIKDAARDRDFRKEMAELRSRGDGRGSGETSEHFAARIRALEERTAGSVSPSSVRTMVDEQLRSGVQRQVDELVGKVRSGMQQQVDELAARVQGELASFADRQKDLRKEVGDLRAQGDGSSASEISAQLAARLRALEDLREEVGDLRARGSDRGAGEVPEQLVARLSALEERTANSVSPSTVSQMVDERVRSGVQKQLDQLATRVDGELGDLVRHRREMACAREAHKEVASATELAERLRAVEERLDEAAGSSGQGSGPAGEDELLRTQVQAQAQALNSQLSEECGRLARLQEGLGGARASLDALEERGGSLEKAERSQAAALEALRSQVKDACQRLHVAEDATSTVKRELEQLRGTRRVGIGLGADPGSPLGAVRKRLDALSEQVADLQETRGRNGRRSALSSRSPPRSSVSPPLSRDASLNFSLTEQTERPAGEGSLNFSLTESKKDLSFSEPLAAVPGKRGDSASAAADGSSVSSGTKSSADSKVSAAVGLLTGEGKQASRLGGLPELKGVRGGGGSGGGSGGSSDALDSLLGGGATGGRGGAPESLGVRGGGSDILDNLVGGGSASSALGGRPRPSALKIDMEERGPLATVVEESSDAGDQSFESHKSRHRNRTPLSAKSALGTAPLDSPSNSGSLENSRSNAEVSVSCQEISIGHDYSVEDSQELDKCDFVEVVRAKVPQKLQEESAPKAGGGSAAKVEDDDNEYGESFDDNGSVSESIQESVDGSGGSDAWGDGEDV